MHTEKMSINPQSKILDNSHFSTPFIHQFNFSIYYAQKKLIADFHIQNYFFMDHILLFKQKKIIIIMAECTCHGYKMELDMLILT